MVNFHSKFFLILFVCIICFDSYAQVEVDPVTGFPIENTEETAPIIGDEENEVKKTKYSFKKSFKEYYPHPKTAVYLGLAFPGGGQLYNKDFWKVPFIWGGYGFLIYLINDNTVLYRNLRDAVLIRLAGGEDMFIETIPSIQSLRSNRDAVRKSLEQSYIALIFVHLLSATEAFVSSHLKGFDVSDDLSIQIRPAILQTSPTAGFHPGAMTQPGLGVGIKLTF